MMQMGSRALVFDDLAKARSQPLFTGVCNDVYSGHVMQLSFAGMQCRSEGLDFVPWMCITSVHHIEGSCGFKALQYF